MRRITVAFAFLALAPHAGGAADAVPAAPAGTSAQMRWTAIARCALEETARGRHACVDRVLQDAGLLTPEAQEREARRAFGLDDRPAPIAPAAPPKPVPAPAAPTPGAAAAPAVSAAPVTDAPPERLQLEVASVATSPDGRLLVTTREGAVWAQSESMTIRQLPAAGETINVRRGALGGYLCTLRSNLTYRCARSR